MASSALIQWEVEAILSDSVMRGVTRYEVKWVGYEATTFEQINNLNNCHDTVQAYLREKSLLKPLTQDNLLALDINWIQPTVELVLGSRMNNQVQEYLVKWQGDEVLSWEPMTNLDRYLDLIFDYLFLNINQLSPNELSQHDFTEMGFDAAQEVLNQHENQHELPELMFANLSPSDNLAYHDVVDTTTSLNLTELDNNLDENLFVELDSMNDQQVRQIFETIANTDNDTLLDLDMDLSMDVEEITDILVNLSNARFF
jgi:hypothetical protein